MKYELIQTYKGYHIRKPNPHNKFYLYVASVYKGNYKWVTDHSHAKHFSLETAKKHIEILKKGTHNNEKF